MPSASRMTTPVAVDEAQIEGRYARLGDYTVSFETFRQDADPHRSSRACPATAGRVRTGVS